MKWFRLKMMWRWLPALWRATAAIPRGWQWEHLYPMVPLPSYELYFSSAYRRWLVCARNEKGVIWPPPESILKAQPIPINTDQEIERQMDAFHQPVLPQERLAWVGKVPNKETQDEAQGTGR